MAVLEKVGGSTRAVLLPRTRIGRGKKSDLVLEGGDVSTNQAVIEWTGERWLVRDAGSKNGTMVDGRVLREGEDAVLAKGAAVVFAEEEAWTVVDDTAPSFPIAIPLAGGGALEAADGVLLLPPGANPEVRVTSAGAEFLRRADTAPMAIETGEVVVAGGKSYRILLVMGE